MTSKRVKLLLRMILNKELNCFRKSTIMIKKMLSRSGLLVPKMLVPTFCRIRLQVSNT